MRFQLPGACCSCVLALFSPLASSQSTQAGRAVLNSPGPTVVRHDHSIRDIDAIGNRNAGCRRGLGNWYSLESQVELGKEYSTRLEATAKLITDPAVTEYVNRLGQALVRNSDAQVAFTIKVIDSDEVNAVALPGGFFYIDSGLITAADNEAELAGVMAHEIAHVAACHAARGRTRGQLLGMASMSISMLGGPIAFVAYQGLSIARPLALFKFSRKFESEADFLGVQYMYRSGYDPQALLTFFERVRAMERGKPGAVARAFSTHPQTADRIERTQKEIEELLPAETDYKVDTSDFQDVKQRINQLQNRLRLQSAKPSILRRVPGGADASTLP